MKILICSPEYPPKASGIGIVVKSVAEEFKRQGHECFICSPTGPDLQLGNKIFIEKFSGLGLLYFWECVRKFFKVNSNNYDSIWLHHPLFIFNSPFKKVLITMHTTYYGYKKLSIKHNFFTHLYYVIMERIERFSLKKLDRDDNIFTYISNQILNEFSKIGICNSKTILISNGINTTKFKQLSDKIRLRKEPTINIPCSQIVFLSVGRLTIQKNPCKLIDVFSKINSKIPNSSMFFAGTGELLNKLKEQVADLNIKNVYFYGFVDEKKLLELYSMSDYYIIASEYEGQPLTLLEALSSGLPCIVSDIPNLRFVNDAKCGIVIDFSDINKATMKIIEYISQDNSSHAQNARKYAEENLDLGLIAGKYLEELKKVIK